MTIIITLMTDSPTLESWSQFLQRTAKLVEDRLQAAGEQKWLDSWRTRQWRWAGKLLRTQQHKWSYTLLMWNPLLHTIGGGQRSQARPCKRWEDDFVQYFTSKLYTSTWQEEALDEKGWAALENDFLKWCNESLK